MKKILRKNFLLGVVFITGAAVLVIEVVAIRILSPYFGNTIFSVSSVLSVILAALSLGYFIGGKLADRNPSLSLFFFIIFSSGISVLFLQFLNVFLLPFLGYELPLTYGPLIMAVILFFLPAFLLGMLSPFVIRLQKDIKPETGVGTVSGLVFFWSTLGSILGSLLAGFVLIPTIGIDSIVIYVGLLLVLLGSIPFFKLKLFKSSLISFSLAIFGVVIALIVLFTPLLQSIDENVVYEDDGLYSHIKIYDIEHDIGTVRYLNRDRNLSSAMILNSSEHTFEYTKYYKLYEIFTPDLENVFALGGGAYTVPKSFINDLSDVSVDVAEIEPELYSLSKQYFSVPENERLKNYVEDGRRFLYETDKKYDFVYSDAYNSFSIPTHLTTKEFFNIAKDSLAEDGVFVANIVGIMNPPDSKSFLLSELKTFQSVFPNSYFFQPLPRDLSLSQNIIFIGYNSDERINISRETENHEDPFIRSLPDKLINTDNIDLSKSDIFTDNYAPVDYLVSKKLIHSGL